MTLRVFSYGGGVQSTAALVLASQHKIDFKTFLFCNVGDDSENPATAPAWLQLSPASAGYEVSYGQATY